MRLAAQKDNESAAVSLRLRPSRPNVGVGDRFDVEVVIDATQPVSHVPINLQYDPSLLEILDVWSGDFLGARKDSQFMAEYSDPGYIVLGASRLGNRPGIQGKGTVAHQNKGPALKAEQVIPFEDDDFKDF